MAEYSGFKWGGAALGSAGGVVTWSFATLVGQHYSFTSAILQQAYRDLVTAAFDLWESVANIDFQFVATDATSVDIRLGWDTIDGANNTVGQAITYYSVRTDFDAIQFSEIRLDTAEDWSLNKATDPNGIDFFAVLVHEIGHTLGLEHTTSTTSIMYPTVGARTLAAADIASIRDLYGAPVVPVPATSGDDTLSGTSTANSIDGLGGSDTISGLGGNDTLSGSDGNDTLYGGDGVDTLNGGTGIDNTQGGAGGDTIYGGADSDSLLGQGGADKLYGDAGADTLNGGGGNDRLTGGIGNDLVISGAGYDVFIFRAGDDADVVRGFANGYDKVDLSDFNFASLTDVKALAHQAGTGVVIDFGAGDTITLENFTKAQLTAGDFLL